MLGIAVAILSAAPAQAQVPAIGAPRGILRFEIGGDFANANDQFADGASQPYRAQFSSAGVGVAFFPGLSPNQARIAQLSGIGGYALSVGGASMQAQLSVGTLRLGATLGITPKLSVFGSVPIVRQQVKVAYGLDGAGGNVAFNPADPVYGNATGAAATVTFLDEFRTALDTLGARIGSGYYDANPADRALADATFASGTAYLAGLDSLFVVPGTAGSFVPLASSAAGQAMSATVASTQGTLATLGIPSFTQPLPLPAEALTTAQYNQYLTAFAGPIGARPFDNYTSFLLGDMELGAAYTLIDRWNRPDRPGGLRVVAQALVRLPTGYQPSPNDFTAVPTGGGQTDLQLAVTADVGGSRFGARFSGSYTNQMAATLDRRVTLPSQPIPWKNRLASVTTDPGNEFALSAMPYFQLAPGLAIVGVVRYWNRGADAVEYASASGAIPGVSASELATDTQRTATVLGGGLSYAPRQAGTRVPMDAFWMYEGVVAASGGVVPKAGTVRMGLRVPVRLWGGPAE
ncbi:MAG TPA: hypothetical protein VFV65_03235 [Gemmatimonadales bacterium]|nr:hypothetical protein [Gemmatimonadales bacterium]